MARVKKGFRFGDYRDSEKREAKIARGVLREDEEVLTGYVRGLPASDLEERMARSLDKYKLSYQFQVEFPTAFSLPYQQRKVDFVVNGDQPLEPAGKIGHYMSIGQSAEDQLRALFLNETFAALNMKPLKTIPYWEVPDQQRMDRKIEDLFL